MLRSARTVIVDEIHAVIGTRRGAHLALSLERLQEVAEAPLLRIGLSATQTPVETVAAFLVGGQTAGGDGPAPAGDDHTAARDALVGLGMSVSEAEAALRPIDEALPVEERVRLALSGAVPAGAGG